jgi:hypothetical protein
MNSNVTSIIFTIGMRIFYFSLHEHKKHKMKKKKKFLDSVWDHHKDSFEFPPTPPPPPNAKLHKVVCLTMGKLQWRSLSLFHNGKILTIKHWNIGPTIPLQNFPSMFRLFNFNSSQVSTLFPCTRNTQNRFLVYLTTWSHIIYQGHIQESAACSCSCSSSFLLISVKFCFV